MPGLLIRSDDQSVDALIEVDKLVDLAAMRRYGKLALEQSGAHIEDACQRIVLADLDADGLDEVGLAHAARSVDEEGVEGLALGIVGYRLADGAGYLVAG